MKLSSPILTLILLAIASNAQLIDPTSELICPDSHSYNCYPKIFVPAQDWQPVREGQQIPPGLHVRLNMDTGEQEAKLVDGDEPTKQEVVLVDNKEEQEDYENKIQDTIRQYKEEKQAFRKSVVSETDLNDYSSSVAEVLGFSGDISRFEKALETLVDLSHDIEFGHRLTLDPQIFRAFERVAGLVSDETQIVEKIYRIMGSALRNNPEAIQNVLEKQNVSFITQLFETLEDPNTAEVVEKRILGVLHALSTNTNYAYQMFNIHDASNSLGLQRLLSSFTKVGKSAQERIVTILEDLSLLEDSETAGDKRSIETSVKPEYKVSGFLQKLLSDGVVSTENQFKSVYKTLVDIHQSHDVRPSKDFLMWLSQEAEERRAGLRKRDHIYSNTDPAFDTFMLETRHGVFGNPNVRKMQDEL